MKSSLTRAVAGGVGLLAGFSLIVLGVLVGSGWLIALAVVVTVAALAWTTLIARRWLQNRRRNEDSPEKEETPVRSKPAALPQRSPPTDPNDLAGEMLWQNRYALLLRPQVAENLTEQQLAQAEEALEEFMALVPEGNVFLSQPDERDDDERPFRAGGRLVRVEAALLDRYLVTNRQYKQFIEAGGYEQMALWDAEIWPAVFGFVDATGHAGPHYWKDGNYPRGEDDHPVVGVSWHEACAYARWVGKRLPADAEWVKAGCWPMSMPHGLPKQRRYPWGDNWEPDRANIWSAGLGHTCSVTEFEDGANVAGVYQLVGNVWEWTADSFGLWHNWANGHEPDESLKSLRGGAFDTYFENQATCQFQSGDVPLARKHNIGFRCAIGLCDLRSPATESEHASPLENELVCEEA